LRNRRENSAKILRIKQEQLKRKLRNKNRGDVSQDRSKSAVPYQYSIWSLPEESKIESAIETESPFVNNGYFEFGKSIKNDNIDYLKERFTQQLNSPGMITFLKVLDLIQLGMFREESVEQRSKSVYKEERPVHPVTECFDKVLGTIDKRFVNTTGTPSFRFSVPKSSWKRDKPKNPSTFSSRMDRSSRKVWLII